MRWRVQVGAGHAADGVAILKQAQEIFAPLPKDMATTEFPVEPKRVALGRALFFDPRISADGTESCVRCHQPAAFLARMVSRSPSRRSTGKAAREMPRRS